MSAPLPEQVAQVFERHGLHRQPGVVAVSGGPDSVALARLCWQLVRDQRLPKITLAHLNHQLRGEHSDTDEEFVAGLASSWNAPDMAVLTHKIDVARLAESSGDNLENAARTARYAWLAETAEAVGAAWVAAGHSADDQAETVLHHFLRGSGLSGLAGMPETRALAGSVVLVRPLLSVRRQTLLDYLAAAQISFRHDASNDDVRFLRNRLRRDLLPALIRDYNPALVEVLGRTARQMRDVGEELAQLASALLLQSELPRAGATLVLRRDALQDTSRLMTREVFRLLWRRENWPMAEMNFADWDRLAALAKGATQGGDFPGGVHVRLVGHVLQLSRQCRQASE
jgi:tRNA(Ile)-lysidine synthase